jgi:hypothetical protein
VLTAISGQLESDSAARAAEKLAALVADTVSDAADAEGGLQHVARLVGAGPADAASTGDRREEEFAA